MGIMTMVLTFTPPVLIAIYTFNYGRWAWKQQYRGGAIGLYLLAAATVLVPIAMVYMAKQPL